MPQSEDSFWSFRLALIVLITGLVTIAIVFVTRFSLTLWSSALDETPAQAVSGDPVAMSFGRYRIAIPGNMLNSSDGDGADKIELAILWPEIEGRTAFNVEKFSDRSIASTVIRLRLDIREEPVGNEERFTRILAPAFEGAPLAGPPGLTGQRFQPGTGFGPDVLYYGALAASSRFMIFCPEPYDQTPPSSTAFCQRLVQLEPDVRLEIRYRPGLLQDWRKIDETIIAMVRQFLTTD